ncbi:hypothetical protein CUJ83_12120 [Methanocella sp. CWC-04]|uniref:Dienelactone hydrolase domain-containing protein n=1 Tax=Methanooceanicella nereidis TaxID=2052831 RepID=A0AAP2RFQ2_9EURY|nr:alpha/beta hydrolase [Methanocella sp. CWC-04]MCD1295745.1 hypothetical protein [Methanocella sp. CWC-04]
MPLEVESLEIKNRNGLIKGELFKVYTDRGILFLHGKDDYRYGPSGMYKKISDELIGYGIASAFIDFRDEDDQDECVSDILASLDHIDSKYGIDRICIVGWGIGGSSGISATIKDLRVQTVITISSQAYGMENIEYLAQRPIMMVHGVDDNKISFQNTVDIARHVQGPKQLILLPDGDHELSSYKEKMADMIKNWVLKYL